MSAVPRLIMTEDGSHSLYLPDMKETYHSTHGALQESEHVFIRHGLDSAAGRIADLINVFEVGLGTGLNVLLTALWSAKAERPVHMTSIEAFPVTREIWEALNYAGLIGDPRAAEWWQSIHASIWGEEIQIHKHFKLTKIHDRLENHKLKENNFDVVYYDAFAPGKQASMWEAEMLRKTAGGLRPGGCLVTYCAQGKFKRDLSELGLVVEPLAGPPGKKEMTRACKPK